LRNAFANTDPNGSKLDEVLCATHSLVNLCSKWGFRHKILRNTRKDAIAARGKDSVFVDAEFDAASEPTLRLIE